MPSFDVMLEPNLVELRNAVDQSTKEVATRFDFKGTGARVEADYKAKSLTLHGDSDFQLGQLRDIVIAKATKRGLDVRFLDFGSTPEKAGGDKLRQTVPVKAGIDAELAKKIQSLLKQSKLKVQAAFQGDIVRVSGGKRDELQSAIALIKREVADQPLSFGNFRE